VRFVVLAIWGLCGCVGLVGGETSGEPSSSGSAGDPGAPSDPDAGTAATGAIARGMEWVVAKVPYCQSANHQPDGDSACSSICERPDNPDWDAYRSDCSGFVSWAWGLPPPGHTTATLAPFDTSVSTSIEAVDLQAGDAINNDTHTMLFVAWTKSDMSEAQFMEEPGCSASQPYAREVTVSVSTSAKSVTVAGYGTFTAIRQK
jgi:hypothetical protein